MEESTGIAQQTSFEAGASGGDSPSSAATDTQPVSEANTNDSPSSDGGGGSTPPATATTGADDSTIAQSEKGSFKLVYNERTGRNEVVSTMPTEQETGQEEEPAPEPKPEAKETKPEQQPQPQQNYGGDELLRYIQAVQQVQQQIPQQLQYVPQQPIPQQVQQPVQQQPTEPVDQTAQAKEYYANVNKMAQERAMQEIGITQDELDVAEYSDDQELLDKVATYKTAIENNRTQIMHDVDNIRRTWEAERADHANAYQAVAAFTQEMKQKEPNFDAIDKLMISRVAKMPFEQAIKVAPLIQKVQNGTLTTADLPALQEMYNQTRLEFYSNKTGVSLAPKPTKPAYVETPGNGAEAPRKTTPLSALGTMSKRDREAAIGQMFGNFFDE